jgi:hypothetical protein
MPIGNGNLELLKVLNVFDVGIGVLTNMVSLDLKSNKLTSWPLQLENLTKLFVVINVMEFLGDDIIYK